jgi:hypothetical protein
MWNLDPPTVSVVSCSRGLSMLDISITILVVNASRTNGRHAYLTISALPMDVACTSVTLQVIFTENYLISLDHGSTMATCADDHMSIIN